MWASWIFFVFTWIVIHFSLQLSYTSFDISILVFPTVAANREPITINPFHAAHSLSFPNRWLLSLHNTRQTYILEWRQRMMTMTIHILWWSVCLWGKKMITFLNYIKTRFDMWSKMFQNLFDKQLMWCMCNVHCATNQLFNLQSKSTWVTKNDHFLKKVSFGPNVSHENENYLKPRNPETTSIKEIHFLGSMACLSVNYVPSWANDDNDDDSDGLEGFLWQYCSTNSRIHSARHNIHSVIVIANPI